MEFVKQSINKEFEQLSKVEEVKKVYVRLAKFYHPDINKNLSGEEFKILNNLYHEKLKSLNGTENETGFKYNYNQEVEEIIISKIKEVLNLNFGEEIKIYLVGLWLWIEGETKPIKDDLKKLKFKWSKPRNKWFFSTTKNKGYSSGSFEDIALKYGLKEIKKKQEEKQKIQNSSFNIVRA